jgi:hypothetical protein
MSTYEFWMHVLVWWRPFGLSLARVVGSMLIGCIMLSIILYYFFRWLIHVGTLADAVSMDLWLLNLLNKLVVCIILIQRPKSPFWKKIISHDDWEEMFIEILRQWNNFDHIYLCQRHHCTVVFIAPIKKVVKLFFTIPQDFAMSQGLPPIFKLAVWSPIRCLGLDLDDMLQSFLVVRYKFPIRYLSYLYPTFILVEHRCVHCIHAWKIWENLKLFDRTCQSDWSLTWVDDLGLARQVKC